MSTFTTTTTITTVVPEEHYRPNVRPDGPEKSPDPNWRAWRLRHQRPEIRETLAPIFPNINPQLRQLDLDKIRQYSRPEYAHHHFQSRKLHDLKDHKPVRLQFRPLMDIFREFDAERQRLHPRKIFREEDDDALPMSWRIEMAQGLFARVWDFCADTFGRECFGWRVNERDWTDFILRKLPAELISCASSVARGDPARHPKPNDPHSYEHLFLAKNERIFLMVGTISKLLHINVFNSLLFGATEEEAKTLNLEDKTTSHTEDGYQRNFSRTNLVRQYLTSGRDLEPQNFWEEVDRVTMGILDLLLPMINFLGTMSPRTAWPTLAEVHQNLHSIVAEAAKLTNGHRVCRAVCWIDFPLTGDLWAVNHEHTSDVIYKESQRITSTLDAETFSKLPEVKDWEIRRADAAGAATRRWHGQEAEAWIRRWESMNPKPSDPSRRAGKVQIVLWPSCIAHFPVGQNTASGGGYNNGEERHTLTKAQVVYYSGDNTALGDQAEDFTLLQHIEKHGGLITRRGIGRFGQFTHGRYESRLLSNLLIALLLFLLLTYSPLLHRASPPADVEVTKEHVVKSTTSLPITTARGAGVETSEHPSITESFSSISTMAWGFWAPWFGGKESSNVKPIDSGTATTATPAETETLVVWMAPPEHVPSTHTVKNIPSSKATPGVSPQTTADASPKSPSPKSTTAKTTKSEETNVSEDDAKPILSSSLLRGTDENVDEGDTQSQQSTRSTKPKVVSKEPGIEHPVAVTRPDSIQSPALVSSPPSRPDVAAAAVGFWEWLGVGGNRRSSSDGLTESDDAHTVAPPGTLPALTAVEERKTVLIAEGASSTDSIVLSKADELPVTLAVSVTSTSDEMTMEEKMTSTPDSTSVSSISTSFSKEVHLLVDKLGASHRATSEPTAFDSSSSSSSSTSSIEAVIQAVGPNQVTVTGPPASAAEGLATEPASAPPATTNDDVWVFEYASIVTHVRRWTSTRTRTYTNDQGQVVTVSEEIPRSTESYSSVAPWHRTQLP